MMVIESKKHTNASIFLLISASFVAVFYGLSFSCLIALFIILLGIGFEALLTEKRERSNIISLMMVVLSVYLFSAAIFVSTFGNNTCFIGPDCLGYYSLLNMKSLDVNPMFQMTMCYGLLSDGNELHELLVRYLIIFANNYLDGANRLYLTLSNVFFGVLASGTLYRILLHIMPSNRAYKYALFFALLSPFHFYSVLFVRDIWIAFFYIHTIEIIISRFKVLNLLLLILFVFIVWGIRLYSGLFIIAFILYYLYIALPKTKMVKGVMVTLVLSTFVVALPTITESELFLSSTDQLERSRAYDEENASSSGFTRNLNNLPTGPREVSLALFSQIMPFPFYIQIMRAERLNEAYMGLVSGFFGIFWYFISYGYLFMLFLMRGWRRLSFEDYLLIGIVSVYIILNLAQTDVRRLMAVYPLIYYMYYKLKNDISFNKGNISQMNVILLRVYLFLTLTYIVIKQ